MISFVGLWDLFFLKLAFKRQRAAPLDQRDPRHWTDFFYPIVCAKSNKKNLYQIFCFSAKGFTCFACFVTIVFFQGKSLENKWTKELAFIKNMFRFELFTLKIHSNELIQPWTSRIASVQGHNLVLDPFLTRYSTIRHRKTSVMLA